MQWVRANCHPTVHTKGYVIATCCSDLSPCEVYIVLLLFSNLTGNRNWSVNHRLAVINR